MPILKVEPLTSARALRGPFDYRLPPAMAEVGVGSVVRVPFGRRRVLGVVVEVAATSELAPARLAEPIEALEAGVPPELVRLGLWVGREFCSTPARGLGLVLPPGTGPGGQRDRAQSEVEVEMAPAGRAALDGGERLGLRQRAVLRALLGGPLRAGELAARAGSTSDVLRRLERRGLVATRTVERRRAPDEPGVGPLAVPAAPSAEQARALVAIRAAIAGDGGAGDGGARELLLHGVTGSGKTEVYLEAARAALAAGRGAIVLVPEIAQTPQAMARFRHRFGDRVALLHSGMSSGQRYDEWRRLRAGEARICVGPRSAVFAPVADLGLIVVDEEHDSSYKQEGDPRYDARDVARHRAAETGAVLLCGTATPRPESWLALERLELPRRVDGRRLPPVEVLDMRDLAGPLHPRTVEALADLGREGGKAIVLVNRRGWTPNLACRSCGHGWMCPSCDVSLVLHRGAGRLRCHHCGHAEAVPEDCPQCGSVSVARIGSGAERIEAAVASACGDLPVLRLDSDAAAGRGAHARILRQFEAASGGVLVGTQMVAKGHDFPEVRLAVVVDADAGLRFPDFRAEERTFALIAQLAGRCGRGTAGGEVLVQTLAPTARSIRCAARHDAAGFLEGELERRRELRYPPFAHLVEVVLSGRDEQRLDGAAEAVRELIAARLPGEAELLGPAPIFRRRDRHRRRLLVKSPERAPAAAAVREAIEAPGARRALRDVAVAVDVEPQ